MINPPCLTSVPSIAEVEAACERPMHADEFRGCQAELEQIGVSRSSWATTLGVNPRTVRSWASGRDEIPPEVARWTRQLRLAIISFLLAHPVPRR